MTNYLKFLKTGPMLVSCVLLWWVGGWVVGWMAVHPPPPPGGGGTILSPWVFSNSRWVGL